MNHAGTGTLLPNKTKPNKRFLMGFIGKDSLEQACLPRCEYFLQQNKLQHRQSQPSQPNLGYRPEWQGVTRD